MCPSSQTCTNGICITTSCSGGQLLCNGTCCT
jgi:hypothetical protein